ncbi:MAG: hypothetical protein A3D92_07655 [Bacteroidetes bacterium RIFCSPHIGHO2_02_FULL_44_7]|nr:MAG: hypothetical protein A3D92_07655 [Bacteroidetes bacterium RIFCSPHIGHO2_02_FULL_44_7]
MCLYAALASLKPILILLLSLTTIFLSQVIPHNVPTTTSLLQTLAIIFYAPNLDSTYPARSLFTIFQWMGFMGLGFFVGKKITLQNLSSYKSKFRAVGLCLLLLFFLVRAVNGFGNFLPWVNLFSREFFILSKYPPSLDFSLVTLGLMFLIWSLIMDFEHVIPSPKGLVILSPKGEGSHRVCQPLLLFGQTSLFFYIVHLYLYGLAAYILNKNVGISLAATWGIWLTGLIPMYFLCSLYQRLKMRHPTSWLQYI